MKWTELDKLRLVEAVIQVEEELAKESSQMGHHSIGNGMGKWRRIVHRLPPEMREHSWDSRRQQYSGRYKCQSQFCTLLQGYRDRLAGKATQAAQCPPSEAVTRMLERREYLLNARRLIPTKCSLGMPRLHVFNAIKSSQHGGVKLLKAISDSMSPAKKNYLAVGAGGKGGFQWTDAARIRLIKAVIKVEQALQESKAIEGNKWELVASLLPLDLRGKTWNEKKQVYNFRCRRVFFNLVYAYRAKLAGMGMTASKRTLTKPVLRLLRIREDLLNARSSSVPVENSFLLSSSDRPSDRDEQRSSATSSEVQYSMFSGGENGADGRSFDRCHELEIVERTHNFSNDLQRSGGSHVGQESSTEDGMTCSSLPSGSVSESKRLETKSAVSRDGSRRRLPNRAQNGEQTQEPFSDSAWRQSVECRELSPERDCHARRMVHESYDDEYVQAIVNTTSRRVNLEKSRLSSWMQDQMVAAGKIVFNEILPSEMTSGKRRKFSEHRPYSVTVTEDHDGVTESKTLRRIIDNKIRTSFQKLRAQFEKELEQTSAKLIEKIPSSFSVHNEV